jgi:hypothetical protein
MAIGRRRESQLKSPDVVISTDSDYDEDRLGMYWNVGGFYQLGGQARSTFNLMQVPVRVLAATFTSTNIDKVTVAVGAHLRLLE